MLGLGFSLPNTLRANHAVSAPAAGPLIPLHSTLVAIGDSITEGGKAYGYHEYAMIALNGRLAYGPGGNLGVPGNRTDEILARIDEAVCQNAAAYSLLMGTNDFLTGRALQDIKDDYDAILAALPSSSLIIVHGVTPAQNIAGAGREADRLALNAWLAAKESVSGTSGLKYISFDDIISDYDDTSIVPDGTHPACRTAKLMGDRTAAYLTTKIESGSILYADQAAADADGNFNGDWDFSGTGGAKIGSGVAATGEVADGWTMVNNTDATIVCSKSTLRGRECQQIDITGTVSSDGTFNIQTQDYDTSWTGGEDYVDSWCDIEITHTDGVSAPVGLDGADWKPGSVGRILRSQTTGFGPFDFVLSGVFRSRPLVSTNTSGVILIASALEGTLLAGAVNVRIKLAAAGLRPSSVNAVATGVPVLMSYAIAPARSGSASVGAVQTVSQPGTWLGHGFALTYQWKRYDAGTEAFVENISGATARTYTLASADIGYKVGCTITATNSFGATSKDTALSATVS